MFSYYSRYDIVFAYAWYDVLWGPTPYGARLHRLGVRMGAGAKLETEDTSVKEVYGHIVRREHGLLVGFERLQKRAKGRLGNLGWPGTYNMAGQSPYNWLKYQGLLDAVFTMIDK